jgi:hypothetical protein
MPCISVSRVGCRVLPIDTHSGDSRYHPRCPVYHYSTATLAYFKPHLLAVARYSGPATGFQGCSVAKPRRCYAPRKRQVCAHGRQSWGRAGRRRLERYPIAQSASSRQPRSSHGCRACAHLLEPDRTAPPATIALVSGCRHALYDAQGWAALRQRLQAGANSGCGRCSAGMHRPSSPRDAER